jgi:hypothetical protein
MGFQVTLKTECFLYGVNDQELIAKVPPKSLELRSFPCQWEGLDSLNDSVTKEKRAKTVYTPLQVKRNHVEFIILSK